MGSKDSSEGCRGQSGSGLPAVKGTTTEPSNQNRRSVLSWLLGGGVTASLVSFFYPVIRRGLEGNVCRCGTYPRIVAAMQIAEKAINGGQHA